MILNHFTSNLSTKFVNLDESLAQNRNDVTKC